MLIVPPGSAQVPRSGMAMPTVGRRYVWLRHECRVTG